MKIALFAITLALFASAVTDAVKLSLRQGANVGTTDKEANGGMGTQIIIQGSVKEPTEEVAAGQAISKCFLDAFNGDFSGLGLKLKELTVDTEVDVPEGDYDGMVTSERRHRRQDMPYISRYIWGFGIYNYKWGCELCPPDVLESEEAAPSFFDALQGPSAGRIHEIFEGDFCECLKQTGLKSYEDVTKCDIEYMYGLGIQEA